jgi:hypothetical protein
MVCRNGKTRGSKPETIWGVFVTAEQLAEKVVAAWEQHASGAKAQPILGLFDMAEAMP